MPSIYRQQPGDRHPKRVHKGSAADVKAQMEQTMRIYASRGYTITGWWNDFVARNAKGEPRVNFFVNEISGSHDEKSGPRKEVA